MINIILLFGPWWSNSIIVILILKEQIEKEFPPAGYETGTFDTATQRADHSTSVITATFRRKGTKHPDRLATSYRNSLKLKLLLIINHKCVWFIFRVIYRIICVIYIRYNLDISIIEAYFRSYRVISMGSAWPQRSDNLAAWTRVRLPGESEVFSRDV